MSAATNRPPATLVLSDSDIDKIADRVFAKLADNLRRHADARLLTV